MVVGFPIRCPARPAAVTFSDRPQLWRQIRCWNRSPVPLVRRQTIVTNKPNSTCRTSLYTREELKSLIFGTTLHGEKYDPQLRWIHSDRRTKHGTDNSFVTYRYNATGSRRMIIYRDHPCGINTYGDSFTHCDQVSDGETWQEVLAAHLIEPVRNYGVGGYSVYQAYLRMVRKEKKTLEKCIMFNVYSDDHYHNLHSWRFIRTRRTARCVGTADAISESESGNGRIP